MGGTDRGWPTRAHSDELAICRHRQSRDFSRAPADIRRLGSGTDAVNHERIARTIDEAPRDWLPEHMLVGVRGEADQSRELQAVGAQ